MADEESSRQGQRHQTQRQGGRRLKQRSKVWEHFTRYTGADRKEKAKCNRCGKEYAYHATKNLKEHLDEGCGGQEPADAGAEQQPQPLPSLLPQDGAMQEQLPPLPPLPLPLPCAPSSPGGSSHRESSGLQEQASKHLAPRPGSALSQEQQAHHGPSLDEEEITRDLARMIALGGHDPSVVEDEYFRSFVRHLNPEFKMPSREAIEEMCDDVFTESWENMAHSWPYAGVSKTIYAFGIAKYIEAGEVLHMTAHFVDDEWKLHRVVVHAYVVLPPGNNHRNAKTFLGVPVISRGEAVERVLFYILPEFGDPPIMVAGEITGDIGCLELKRIIDQEWTVNMEKVVICFPYVDHVLHSVARCLLPDSDVQKKMLSMVLDLWKSRKNRQELLSKLGLDDPWEHNEHWYWCYCSLKMSDDEHPLMFEFQRLLCNVWGKIYGAMKRISALNTPTSALCLGELLKVRDVLQSQLSEASATHEGMSDNSGEEENFWLDRGKRWQQADVLLRKALETVDKALEDSYLVWSIPLVLDPRYKLRHIEESFRNAFDDSKAEKYTSEVRRMIKELYTPDAQCHSQDVDSRATTNRTELDLYLEDSPARTTKGFHFDILNWWKVHGSVQYPRVAEMARAVLAMPTCSKLTSDQTAHVRGIIRGYKLKESYYW